MASKLVKAISINARRFSEYIDAFGFPSGVIKSFEHFIKFRSGISKGVQSTTTPDKAVVWLRPGTSDLATYREVFVNGEYDIRKQRLFNSIMNRYNSLLEQGRTPLIVDAGANIGLASVFLSHLFPQAEFQLVEASSENVEVIRRNIAGNPRMNVWHRALWHEKSRLTLVGSKDFSTIRVKSDAGTKSEETVETITMNEIVGSRGGDLFILKIDIEGAEKVVLAKNNEWLNSRPIILIEPHDDMIPNNGSLSGLLNIRDYQDANIIINISTLIIVPRHYVIETGEKQVA